MGTELKPYTDDQIAIIKESIAKGVTDQELALFIQVCQRTQLDPFMRQIYAIRRGGKMTIQTSIDGFRAIAQDTGEYEGQTAPEWCGPDGIWHKVWLDLENPPFAARVGVWRKNFREPAIGIARWINYDAARAINGAIWKAFPDLKLAICAESQALRKAFQRQLGGLYTDAEMDQADRHYADTMVIDAEPEKPFTMYDKPKTLAHIYFMAECIGIDREVIDAVVNGRGLPYVITTFSNVGSICTTWAKIHEINAGSVLNYLKAIDSSYDKMYEQIQSPNLRGEFLAALESWVKSPSFVEA